MSHGRLNPGDNQLAEASSVNSSFVAVFVVGIAALVVTAIAATSWLYLTWSQPRTRYDQSPYLRTEPVRSAGARLSVQQHQERLAYESKQRELLTTYSWSDRHKGIARIPLDEAIKRLAKRDEAQK